MLIGILADTHIPHRVPYIPEDVCDAFDNVDVILHAGDVDEAWALEPLRKIAPVYAVRGNYHIIDRSAGGRYFPPVQHLSLCGYRIVMTHGHRMGWSTPFWKFYGLLRILLKKFDIPWRDHMLCKYLIHSFPQADIIIFGHTHRYYSGFWDKKLLINPGAACASSYFSLMNERTVAVLTLCEDRKPSVERINLPTGH